MYRITGRQKFEFSTAIKRAIGTSAEAVEKTRQLLQNGRLKISLGKEDITTAFVSDEALIVTGSNVEKLPQLSIKENDEMEFSIEADPDKKQYCLRVRAKKYILLFLLSKNRTQHAELRALIQSQPPLLM